MYQQMYTKIKDGQGEDSFEHLIHGNQVIIMENYNEEEFNRISGRGFLSHFEPLIALPHVLSWSCMCHIYVCIYFNFHFLRSAGSGDWAALVAVVILVILVAVMTIKTRVL